MLTLLNKFSQNPTDSLSGNPDKNTAIYDQSMSNQHICPCCSYTLLRHIDLDGIYWYCSHCHQEIPVYNESNTTSKMEI